MLKPRPKHAIGIALRLGLVIALGGLAPPASWAAEARLLTQADIDTMGGPAFQGGVGDYLLKNSTIEAVILAVVTTPDGVQTTNTGLGSYFSNALAPTGGILIDLMTTGDANDQLRVIAHTVNLHTNMGAASGYQGGSIHYRGLEAGFPSPELTSGPTASITVYGAVVFPALGPTAGSISSIDNPTVTAMSTYTLSGLNDWIEVTTTITNNAGFTLSIFTVGDESRHLRNQLVFQPFPFRGSYAPPASFRDPQRAIGVMPWLPMAGLLDDSLAPPSAVAPICYAFVAPSLSEPFVAVDMGLRSVIASRKYNTTVNPAGIKFINGTSMTFVRRILATPGGAIEDCADAANPMLYVPVLVADQRASFVGRVVDPAGTPIPDATLIFDNISPGFPVDLELNSLFTEIDDDQNGVPDSTEFAVSGSAVPATQVRTAADGVFSVDLQAVVPPAVTPTVYGGMVFVANRPTVTLPPLTVDVSTIATGVDLGDLIVNFTGTLEVEVTDDGNPTPARIVIFGTGGTENPDFGDQFRPRTRFSGLEQYQGDGGDPLNRRNSNQLSEAKRGYPAINVAAAPDGIFSLQLAPGDYEILASRGPEFSYDSAVFSIAADATTQVSLTLSRVAPTAGWQSVDGHVHSALSDDSGVPLADRVISMLAAGVDTMISTDHDQIVDYAPQIQALGVDDEISSVIGTSVTGESAVPVSTFTDGSDAYPRTTGHIIGWPLSPINGNRRGGVPTDEQLIAATVFDRIRGMDSLPLLGATPDTATLAQWLAAIQAGRPGTPGAVLPTDDEIIVYAHPRGTGNLGPFRYFGGIGVGYDPGLPVDVFPNTLADLRSHYHANYVGAGGTSTRGLHFDALELLTSTFVDWYLLTRADWFSLLNQGIHRAAVTGSNTHRVIDGAGYPRFYVPCEPCTEQQLIDSVRNLRVVGTTGPFIRFEVVGDGETDTGPVISDIGNTVTATSPVQQLRIEITAAPWIPVEELRIFRNGMLLEAIDIAPANVLNGPVLRYDKTLAVANIGFDAYFVVEAGNKITAPRGAPVDPDLLITMRRLTTAEMISLAFTNPVFVDADGDGYVASPGGIFASSFESGGTTAP